MRTPIHSRLLTRAELRSYLGALPWAFVLSLMERGKLPQPLWKIDPAHGEARWDRQAVNHALDAETPRKSR